MVILTLKAGEKVQIGDDITVTLTEVERNKVKLGVRAPRSVPIMRDELLTRKDDETPRK